jgi:predicted nucleic acid-binding protein
LAGYVLDTSAIMAVVFDEDGAQQVRDLVRSHAHEIALPFLAQMEVHYKLLQEAPEMVDEALAMISEWAVETVESSVSWRDAAAIVKARGKLSLADAWMAALALLREATLVHKDPQFEAVPDLLHNPLPYKGRNS